MFVGDISECSINKDLRVLDKDSLSNSEKRLVSNYSTVAAAS